MKHKKPTQQRLFKKDLRFFGGRLLHGRRRTHRPLNTKEAIHLVMRSSWAMGADSFLHKRNKSQIERLITVVAQKYRVRVYQKAIASNHVHLMIKIESQKLYSAFIRALAGKIASQVMRQQSFKVFRRRQIRDRGDGGGGGGASAGEGKEIQGLGQQFWQFRPWTRLIAWGKDYLGCCKYVARNSLEALGFIAYKPRGKSPYLRWYAKTCGGLPEGRLAGVGGGDSA
jgi:REP element-mobilizing transposase RayT